jgi:hypothetical protein
MTFGGHFIKRFAFSYNDIVLIVCFVAENGAEYDI